MAKKDEASAAENSLMTWNNAEFGTIRSMTINGEPWFVAKDLAKSLGYKDTVNALKQHVAKEDRWGGEMPIPSKIERPYVLDKLGRKQHPVFINESGLYSLIFGSQLENAKKFKHWVTSEVLPAIRKSGNFMASPVVSLKDIAVALQKVTDRVSSLEQCVVKSLSASPAAKEPDNPPLTDSRERVSELVKQAARANGLTERETWYDLYRSYSKLTGIPLLQCAKAMGMSVIAFVDLIGRMESLKKFAEQVFWFV